MSIRETSRALSRSAKDRWPLQFDTVTPEETTMSPVPLVKNRFATDDPMADLTPAQKKALLDKLLKETFDTAGQVMDLSRPIVISRPAPGTPEFEYPKAMYHHGTGHYWRVENEAQEKQWAGQGYKTTPAPDRDYSQVQHGRVAPMKPGAVPRAVEDETEQLSECAEESPAPTEEISEIAQDVAEAEAEERSEDRPRRRR